MVPFCHISPSHSTFSLSIDSSERICFLHYCSSVERHVHIFLTIILQIYNLSLYDQSDIYEVHFFLLHSLCLMLRVLSVLWWLDRAFIDSIVLCNFVLLKNIKLSFTSSHHICSFILLFRKNLSFSTHREKFLHTDPPQEKIEHF